MFILDDKYIFFKDNIIINNYANKLHMDTHFKDFMIAYTCI